MRYRLDRGFHSVYALYYHYVQVVKYRRKVFESEEIINFLKEQIQEISKTFEVEVIDIGVDKDHFHMLFKAKPTLNIPRYINAVKTITSREIQRIPTRKGKTMERTLLVTVLLTSNEWAGNTRGAKKICGEPRKRITKSNSHSGTRFTQRGK